MTASNLQIEVLLVEALIPFATNAKLHSDGQVAQIAASIREVFTSIGFNIEATTGPRLTNLASVQESIAREFNLPMNRAGRRLGRDIDILDALTPCLR